MTPSEPQPGQAANSRPLTEIEVWQRYDADEARLTAAVSERMLDLAGLRPGMRVLDLATGRGEPALRAARRVGPHGVVVGIELSDALLQMTRERAAREGITNLELRAADAAASEDLAAGSCHAVTSRWGLMYMTAPVAALIHARRASRPDGVLVAALWAEPERVPYFTLPRQLLARYRRIPPIDPEAPGTFRFADLARILRDFAAAGWQIDHVEEMQTPVLAAASDAAFVAWVRALGLTRLLGELPAAAQQAWEQDLLRAAAPTRTGGVMQLGGVTRLVRARPL